LESMSIAVSYMLCNPVWRFNLLIPPIRPCLTPYVTYVPFNFSRRRRRRAEKKRGGWIKPGTFYRSLPFP
jgi:hypothetical protein